MSDMALNVKKKFTKLNALSNDDRVMLAINMSETNQKELIKKEKKKSVKKQHYCDNCKCKICEKKRKDELNKIINIPNKNIKDKINNENEKINIPNEDVNEIINNNPG